MARALESAELANLIRAHIPIPFPRYYYIIQLEQEFTDTLVPYVSGLRVFPRCILFRRPLVGIHWMFIFFSATATQHRSYTSPSEIFFYFRTEDMSELGEFTCVAAAVLLCYRVAQRRCNLPNSPMP